MDWADRNYKIWEGSTREMDMIQHTIENISNTYKNPVISTSVICSVLVMALLIGLYEFAVYRLVSHRAFYNLYSDSSAVYIHNYLMSAVKYCDYSGNDRRPGHIKVQDGSQRSG